MIPHIQTAQIKNYKSIANSVVRLCPFTVFVGPNGSGKSNFIDALAFVQDCLASSIELAFKNRGGIQTVRRRSGGHPTHIGIRLSIQISDSDYADYSFEIAAEREGGFHVARENCIVGSILGESATFSVEESAFVKEIPGIRPKLSPDRLALFAASATDEFRPVYDFLTSMRFYSIAPDKIRELQEPDPGDFLKQDGSNAAAILKRLKKESNGDDRYNRICRLLSKVAEGVRGVDYRQMGRKETLQFKQIVSGQKHPWTFDALSMSDGTLRVLGLLLAVFQSRPTAVVAIEEPEATVHPAITEMVTEVLVNSSEEKQVLITTHSPDILDYKGLNDKEIRIVTMTDGVTSISPLADSGRNAIRERLYTPGELFRVNELGPNINEAQRLSKQLNLFGPPRTGGESNDCQA